MNVSILDRYQYVSNRITKSHVWGRLYKKDCIKDILFDETEKVEDAYYNMLVILNNENLKSCYCDNPLYDYYVRDGSLVNYIGGKEILNLIKKYYDLACNETNTKMRETIFIDILKRGLSARYSLMIYEDKIKIKECNI